jgi:hypothetical protein
MNFGDVPRSVFQRCTQIRFDVLQRPTNHVHWYFNGVEVDGVVLTCELAQRAVTIATHTLDNDVRVTKDVGVRDFPVQQQPAIVSRERLERAGYTPLRNHAVSLSMRVTRMPCAPRLLSDEMVR